jgi:hypothetical protein
VAPDHEKQDAKTADVRRRADEFARRAYADVLQRFAALCRRRSEQDHDAPEAGPAKADESAP